MTSDLFDEEPPQGGPSADVASRRKRAQPKGAAIVAAEQPQSVHALAAGLPGGVHLGTSTWSFPGWGDLVWADAYSDSSLSRAGLAAYAAHPLFRTVSVDRAFYRPMTEAEYARLAAQAPDTFRFVVKAPSLVTDAVIRAEDGRGREENPAFLDPELALSSVVRPALLGLQSKLGVIVFQLSPLPARWLRDRDALFVRLGVMLAQAVAAVRAQGSAAVMALELRDRDLLSPQLAACLKSAGASYCVGVHPRMPSVEDQLPMVRALWPGPAVCRWNLNARHGAQGYEQAKAAYGAFDTLVDADPENRAALARLVAGTVAVGLPAYVTINNKAEGSAPRSVHELAQAIETALARRVAEKSQGRPVGHTGG